MIDHTQPRRNGFFWSLACLPPAGILINSVILFTINKLYPPVSTTPQALLMSRFSLRHAAELADGICFGLFELGALLLIWHLIRRGKAVPYRALSLPFCASCSAMFLCSLPFVLFDRTFWGDYLFPIWGKLIIMALVLLILTGINFRQHLRSRT